MLVLTVADRGRGLPAEALPFVFDKFYRGPSAPAGGTGLGLAIVKGFVEAQGGQVTAENRPGGGAVFTVRLPLSKAPPVLEASAGPQRIANANVPNLSRSTVQRPAVRSPDSVPLVSGRRSVQIRRLLRVCLEANGYRVLEAATGQEAHHRSRAA